MSLMDGIKIIPPVKASLGAKDPTLNATAL